MAWRDSRRGRRRLLLFSSPLILGVAALVAIQSLRDNVNDAIEEQSRALLGADLLLSARQPFAGEAATLIKEIGGEQTSEIAFTTMAYSEKADMARLVHLRGVNADFPFYGDLETTPAGIWESSLASGTFVLEQNLVEQFQLQPGDTLKLGNTEHVMAGALTSSPPRASLFAAFAPQVLIPLADIEKTGLLTARSLAFYRTYIKLPPGQNPHKLAEKLDPKLDALRISWQTPEKRRRGIGKQLDRLYRFLKLIGLASIILGGIGISSAIHQHISRRLPNVAILRCMGCTARQAFGIYVIQATTLGLIGCAGGVLLGVAIQAQLPALLSAVAPLEIPFQLSPTAIFLAASLSMIICVSFSLFPLLKIRRVPPLAAIRSALLNTSGRKRDPWAWGIGTLLVTALLGFSLLGGGPKKQALFMAGGLIAVFMLLALVTFVATWASRKLARHGWSFAMRQGLANLYRPNNQTFAVVMALGLGVFLILTLLLVQRVLLQQLDSDRLAEKGNVFLLDVQPDQQAGVERTLAEHGSEVIQTAPLISMRLLSVKGRSVSELVNDEKDKVPGWILRRDFRTTYRSEISESEKLLDGQWIARVENYEVDQAAPVSIEKGIAEDLKITVGDEIEMDVQGVSLRLVIANIREVDWGTMGLNFFLVFPEGILEEALSYHVYTTFISDPAVSGRLQTALTKAFPNVTVIDLTLVIEALEDILSKVAMAIRFMAAFTVFTGLLILVATLVSSRGDRLRQMALLRTLGCSSAQIWRILCSEYVALGVLASLAGAALALLALWPLTQFVFETPFLASPVLIFAAVLLSSLATLLLGLMLSRGLTRRPPLEVIRDENLS